MQNNENKISLSLEFESLKKLYDDLQSNFSKLQMEEDKYSRFLLKQTPARQQKISNEIQNLFSKFNNHEGVRDINLSKIKEQITLIARKVALKEKHVTKLRDNIVFRYVGVYKEKVEKFSSSSAIKGNAEYSAYYKKIRQKYSNINERISQNGLKNSDIIDEIFVNIDKINTLEQINFDLEYSDSSHLSSLGESRRFPLSETFKKSIASITSQDQSPSFPPARSSSQIGNSGSLAMAGATLIAIFLARSFLNNLREEKGSKIKQEIKLKNKDINTKLALILDYNIKFDSDKSSIEFNNFSPELCQKMAKFFKAEGMVNNISEDFSKGLTLTKIKDLAPDKFNQVFDKFIIQFKGELDQEKQQIAQKKQVEEDSRTQQEKITELQDLVNKAIIEFKNIKIGEGDKSRSGKAKESNKEEIKARQKYEKEQRIISEKVGAMENYAKDVKKFESILSQEQIDFFDKKFREFKDLTSKQISFEAVRAIEVKVPAQENVIKIQDEDQQEQVLQAQDNEPIKIPDPAPAPAPIQNLLMPDLTKLKALFLEEGYIKIYYEKKQTNSAKFEELSLGFLHHEALKDESFQIEYKSPENQKSFREFGGINPTDENLAKHYFHQLLNETVEKIYQKSAGKSDLIVEEKQSIKDNLYSFLNYAMGDMDSVLKDYEKREIEGKSRGGLTGLGHGSGAKLEDLEKLCLCLKMFKGDGKLSQVESQGLNEFVKFEIFLPKFINKKVSYEAEEILIQENSDDIFAQNLISELSNQSEKLAGQERLENVVKDFFSSNAQKILEKLPENCGDYSQKISQVIVTTDCDGNIFQYLVKNLEIVKDIVDFANGEDLSVPPKAGTNIVIKSDTKSSLKDELKSVCERLKSEIGEIESSRGRAL